MIFDIASRVLGRFPPEFSHRATIATLSAMAPLVAQVAAPDPRLAIRAIGLTFPNPIGLAAGFDKNAQVVGPLLKLGFGFVECGSLTPRPQPGNPTPRLFRLREDRAVINRMGFNNAGMEKAAQRLSQRGEKGIVGINIGANKDSIDRIADYCACFLRLAPFADYVTLNVSSPNTEGLRGLQNKDELDRLLSVVTTARSKLSRRVPVLLKIAPDLDGHALDDIAAISEQRAIEGIVLTNTTIARPHTLGSRHAQEAGGLSGAPLFGPSTQILREMRSRVGTKLSLIGVGGVASGRDAYAKIRAGASLVQLYTALVYEGPSLIGRLRNELLDCLIRDGFGSLSEAVGADV